MANTATKANVKYDLVVGLSRDILVAKVNSAIERNWKPFGDPFYADGNYCQAMMLYSIPMPPFVYEESAVELTIYEATS
jgi:hypothetical protein